MSVDSSTSSTQSTSNDHDHRDLHNQVLNNDKMMETYLKMSIKKCSKRCVSRVKIVWAFMSFLLSVTDVMVIIYLSYVHFTHSHDDSHMMAWLMLLPILLNFIGIFTFLSNEAERKEMESLGCGKMKHLMFFPVIGPSVSQLRLFAYAFEEHNVDKYERLESLLLKMKQYESFFRAAPEAFIQITFRIVNWSNSGHWQDEDYWTSLCIALCMFALAESNIYAAMRPDYYRLFNYCSDTDTWRTDTINVPWRIALFWFNYLSIASRLFADAIFRATACFYFSNVPYAEVIIMTFIFQFVGRAIIRAIYQNTLIRCSRQNHDRFHRDIEIRPAQIAASESLDSAEGALKHENEKEGDKPARRLYVPVQEDMTGVYGAFTYSWRCLFMSFDYQDWVDPIVYFGFYVENVLIIGFSYVTIQLIEYDLSDKTVYYVYSVAAVVGMVIAIILKYTMVYALKRRHLKRVAAAKF